MKRILTIQDISCVGKCSLTVALPIISAMGVETAIIPTAVLSTHTMFKNFTFHDLTDEIVPITKHWKSENIGFDSIYTGYLGSIDQIEIIANLFDEFKTEDNLIIVDPVMADNGKLYPAFDEAFASKMATLCAKADIILPNITEASFMTGMEYKEKYDEEYIKEMLIKLSNLGAKISVLTGVSFNEGTTGVMGYDREKGEYYYYPHKRIDAVYHGTGDIFASTFVGAMGNNLTWKEAIPVAADYTAKCIELTLADKKGRWYGVNFEEAIPYLLKRIGK
ncbi:pyridoxine kinase [Herbinix hemicellulosilytica]|uniref:pyridoxal kinase n=1 Tax=Herbinix hemicellulosilytica TaxID=1564487 RepID=A0A0H5SFA8_HERHM|nr:pyridoxamine kinase [Herbinix hemicellulosilytica]RBP58402.1 pyridoxine kinase [Herbinix hemicellulosilytica]CRZ34119.1 putative membrane protein [Herbinix hemicellulosilytica]